jgi:hypothetical protein
MPPPAESGLVNGARRRGNGDWAQVVRLAPGPAWPAHLPWPPGEHTIPIGQPLPETKVGAADLALTAVSLHDGRVRALVCRRGHRFEPAFDADDWLRHMTAETYRPERVLPLSARLPFHYHRLPGFVRNAVAGALLAHRSAGIFPAQLRDCGPLLVSLLLDDYVGERAPKVAVLTHDIDTAAGLQRIKAIAEAERAVGARACWNVVPRHYPIDNGQLEWLANTGHEIGLHGIWHTNKEAFLSRAEFTRELDGLTDLRVRFAIRTYRGPSWYRTSAMFDVLAEHFDADLTTLDIDLVCPGGPGGVGLPRAFRIRPNLIEIPCTVPFEAPMIVGPKQQSLTEFWRPKIEMLGHAGGMAVINTHPDPNYLGTSNMLADYRRLLSYLAESGWTFRLPREIAIK